MIQSSMTQSSNSWDSTLPLAAGRATCQNHPMGEEKPKTGGYRLGSAIIWAAAQGALAWFAEAGVFKTSAAAAAGLIAGWATAGTVGRLTKWGTRTPLLLLAGIVLGVAFSSGAVAGLTYLRALFAPTSIMNWDELRRFILSGAALPAAVLGLVTALYVRARTPRPE